MSSEVEIRFLDFMRGLGLAPVKDAPSADGRIHRYRVEGDKPGSQNGWYVLHLEPIPHGAVGSWRTGETHPWRDAEARKINWRERMAMQRSMEQMRQRRYQEQKAVWAEARAKAAKLWRVARPASINHPYLQRKQVKPWGIRQLHDNLVIPLRDVDGVMHSLQFIGPDGNKKFLTGGMTRGCYHAIGKPEGVLCIAEGYATAATVFEATGYACACAFNAGNLEAVARKLRNKFYLAGTKIILIADDDRETPGNPGLTKATEAARIIGGYVARPDFSEVRAA